MSNLGARALPATATRPQQARRSMLAATLLLVAVTNLILARPAAAAGSLPIKGTVACPAGLSVVGVWIQSSGGGSQFADWARYPGASTIARFSKTLTTTLPSTVYLNVGCGGSTTAWGSSSRTPSMRVSSSGTLFFNVECGSVGSCFLFPMENNTPAASSTNPFPAGQCTERAAAFWKEMTGRYPNWRGNAGWWDDNAAATGWTVRSWPRPDSVAVWQPGMGGSGPNGHVGYIADTRITDGKLQIKIYDRNWGLSDRNGIWVDFIPGMKFLVVPPRIGPGR